MSARRPISLFLVVIGALAGVLGVLLVRTDQRVFTRAAVVSEVDRVLADPDVSRLVIRTITDRVVEAGNLGAQRDEVEQTVTARVESEAMQTALRSSLLGAYDMLTTGDTEVIDMQLGNQGAQLRRDLVKLDPALGDVLPSADQLVQFTLFERNVLPWAYRAVDSSRSSSWVILVAGLALIGVGLVLGPGRLSLISVGSLVAAIAMLVVWFLVTTGANRVIGSIDDPLARRVTRLAVSKIFGGVERLSLAVAIGSAVVCVGGLLATAIRNAYFPPRPKRVLPPSSPFPPTGTPFP